MREINQQADEVRRINTKMFSQKTDGISALTKARKLIEDLELKVREKKELVL